MKKQILVIAGFAGLSHFGFSQFHVKDVYFETHAVSNQGKVVGYEGWAGPYSVWTPENGNVEVIGGLAPGNGIGGRATFSTDGNFLSGTSQGPNGPEMARYSVTGSAWTPVGSLGFPVDGTYSGGYCISGDGNTIVGLSWADTTGGYAYAHAIAWNEPEGIMDLGTLFFGRSTRANAVSNDGSVAVGWQDFNGPWKSAVWKKNPAGGYFPNQYILLDPLGDSTDEYNQMGECSVISGDGTWIGGYGDYANNNNPWIWSEATGVIDLGTLAVGGSGSVYGINDAGTMVVGRIQQGPWDPELPFIWTPAGGIENLNDYAHNTLGLNTGNKVIYSANCMSPDGNYIAGYGVDTVTFDFFAYRMSMIPLGIAESAMQEIRVYPNPSTDHVTIQLNEAIEALLTITDAEGKLLSETTISGEHQLDITAYAPGVYFLSVWSQGDEPVKTIRFVKK